MAGHRNKRFSIFDAMDDRGDFISNPNNSGAQSREGEPLYKGPTQYPKMMYHPMGEERITSPQRIEPTSTGPVIVPETTELVHRVVETDAQYQELRKQGWHDHPAQALAAAGKTAPEMGLDKQKEALERQIAALQAQLALAQPASAPKTKG
jgi:hypothetical protein